MSDQIERPWALMRHHAGWADVFHIDSESADSITGFYPDRETVGPPVNYSVRAVLARFPTMEAARAAREGAVLEWRKHDASVLMASQEAPPYPGGILIDQGLADKFLLDGQLLPEAFEAACEKAGQPLTLRRQPGYDHGYYFIQTFMADHMAHHAKALAG